MTLQSPCVRSIWYKVAVEPSPAIVQTSTVSTVRQGARTAQSSTGLKLTGVQICFHISYGPLSSISAPQTFGNCCMCAQESLRAVVKLRVESVKHASANLNKNLNLLRSLELWPEQTREYAKRLPCVQLRTKAHSHSLPFDRYWWQ